MLGLKDFIFSARFLPILLTYLLNGSAISVEFVVIELFDFNFWGSELEQVEAIFPHTYAAFCLLLISLLS